MTNTYILIFILVLCALLAFTCVNRAKPLSDKRLSLRNISAGITKKEYTDGQTYFLYVPKQYYANKESVSSILAIIHGYTGNQKGAKGIEITKKNLSRWIPYAEKYNCILVAPHFDEVTFDNDYQRLNLDGIRSDLRLNSIIDSIKTAFPDLKDSKLKLFGFSGGGQFVHRYCAFHPDMVDKAVVGASGWYMWPDDELDYPLGTRLNKFPQIKDRIDLKKFIQTDMMVIVGDADRKQGAFRDSYKDADLDKIQGENRLERAKRWVNELNILDYKNNIKSNVKIEIAENTEHEISSSLLKKSAIFLFD